MPTITLPQQPDLGQLRKQARELQRGVRSGDSAALALVAEYLPDPPPTPAYPLSAAQTVLARRYGFAGWTRLLRHVAVIAERTWVLPESPAAQTRADQFLRLACLNYTQDDPGRRSQAARLVARHPELPSEDVAVAAACVEVDHLRRLLEADPVAASRRSGPFGWSPLMYQAYARHDREISVEASMETTKLLLAAGADPNDGRFFLGLPTPFTVLTGLFANDSAELPAHPHAVELARTLLRAGADANDGQTLYNRMFGVNDDHLRLLIEFGLGRGDGGPWRRLLGDQVESPEMMLSALLDWAVSHDQRDRVELLAANGVDVISPIGARRFYSHRGRTPVEVALLNGNREMARQLRGYGGSKPRLNPRDRFIAAALAGDGPAVRAIPTEVAAAVVAARPGLIVWAASQGRIESVELLIGAGFDVNAFGRHDTPVEGPWETALHAAVTMDDVALAQRLLELGADPDLLDKRFRSTPLGWARHFGRPLLTELLEPVTTEPAG